MNGGFVFVFMVKFGFITHFLIILIMYARRLKGGGVSPLGDIMFYKVFVSVGKTWIIYFKIEVDQCSKVSHSQVNVFPFKRSQSLGKINFLDYDITLSVVNGRGSSLSMPKSIDWFFVCFMQYLQYSNHVWLPKSKSTQDRVNVWDKSNPWQVLRSWVPCGLC